MNTRIRIKESKMMPRNSMLCPLAFARMSLGLPRGASLLLLLGLVVVSCYGQTGNISSGMVITVNTPWVVADDQPEAVQRALEDVKKDWYKVFGHLPVVIKETPVSWKGPVIYLGLKGAWRDLLVKEQFAGTESFIMRVQRDDAGRSVLVATGADIRGSIYAAYAFSEEILGVDPWYYWVDKEPAARNQIEIPAGFNRQFGPPTFKYRGWFINDEDLLGGFSPDPLRENVFSLEMYDRIYETLLRLRGNMIVPATFQFPDERCQELAAHRGLILNMHHILVLGLNTYRWPKDVPFSYSKHPDIMERYWQTCINAFKDYEVVWTVGYRGKHDRPFWADEPELKTPEQRGEVITRAIVKQVELIRKMHPNAAIIANMWMEGADLYHQGHIKLPEGVTLVWPDNGAGMIRDEGHVQAGQGTYYHTAMLSGEHNQLSEMVNPGRIYNQIGRFVRAGATAFFLVNVSDIRPVPLSTDCAMKLVWDSKPYIDKTDEQNMTFFLQDWSRRQFGLDVADKIATIYRQYFNISYMRDEVLQGENSLHTKLRRLNQRTAPLIANGKLLDKKSLDMCQELLKFSSENHAYVAGLLNQAEPMLQQVPDERRKFYQSHVLTQIQIHLQSLVMLESYCQSLLANNAGEKAMAVTCAKEALQASDQLFAALHKTEYGKWSYWYIGERFVGLDRSYDCVRVLLARLQGEPSPPIRNGRGYEELYQYQQPFSKNFPLLYPAK